MSDYTDLQRQRTVSATFLYIQLLLFPFVRQCIVTGSVVNINIQELQLQTRRSACITLLWGLVTTGYGGQDENLPALQRPFILTYFVLSHFHLEPKLLTLAARG